MGFVVLNGPTNVADWTDIFDVCVMELFLDLSVSMTGEQKAHRSGKKEK